MKKKFIKGLSFVTGFVLSIIAIILPWRVRIAYMRVIGGGANIMLRFKFVADFVDGQAFSKKSEKELLLRQE
ncbi:MAG: hypothetical protein JSW60_06585 [Thermoplasmatales archaeon]|nr:MAG: hypothetical protein JSW60_06585 [Thermoplasmatales archaeon]